MTRSGTFKLIGLAVVVVLAIIVYRLLGGVIGAKVEQQVAKVGLTANEVAAHGPLPGDVSLYAKELACQQKISTPGYYPSLNGAEISDSERSGVFPCATFLGSMDGPNQVFAWRSEDDYPGISYINNRKPGELYIVGGEYPTLADPNMVGPFVAKADATTGKQIWRTYLDNLNASGHWIGNANLNILPNGNMKDEAAVHLMALGLFRVVQIADALDLSPPGLQVTRILVLASAGADGLPPRAVSVSDRAVLDLCR